MNQYSNKIRLGIIGCGGISNRMAGAFAHSGEVELCACAARDKSRAEAFADKFGAKKAYGNYEELIEASDVDAIYIGTVHTEHFAAAKKCVEAGKPVLCEKPFFISAKEARELTGLARRHNILIMESMWMRFLPAVQKIREWIRNGRIGELKTIQADFCFDFPYNEKNRNFRLWNPEVAGGALWDAGVYVYEYFTFLVGEHPDRVQGIPLWEHGVDAVTALQLHFPSGILATGRCGFYSSDQTAQITGTEGSIRSKDFWQARTCELYRNNEMIERFEDAETEGFIYEIRHFANLVRRGKTESPIIPFADMIDFVENAEKILAE